MTKRQPLLLKSLLALFACALFMAVPSTLFAQNFKVGYVNLQRALNEVKEGKAAKARLKKDFEKKKMEA